jgi:hypothetical protein
MNRSSLLLSISFILIAGLFSALAPLEKTLGGNARLVYFHGAWVWASLLGFLAAGLAGLLAWILRKETLHAWSLAFGRSALVFWIAFLPMSLAVMQANWNGLFLDEPRFRGPLNLAIVGLLLQIGLALLNEKKWASLGNLGFTLVLFSSLSGTQSVLHPESPIFGSGSVGIQVFFILLVLLLTAAAWQHTLTWLGFEKRREQVRARRAAQV